MEFSSGGRETDPINRNKGLIVGIVLFLSATMVGCGENSGMLTAVQTLRTAAFGVPETEIDREQLSNIPYALLSARVGKLPPAILVLGYDEPYGQQWFSTNAVSVTTRHGRIVQTVGMPIDIRETRQLAIDPLSDEPQHLNNSIGFSRELFGWGPGRSTSVVNCVIRPGELETITIGGVEFETRHLIEACEDSSGYNFSNAYWVDIYDGFVWRSIQKWGRKGPEITTAVLKPPAKLTASD